MRIIIHFGMPKTGSTSIEKSLHQNKSINVCYPDFGQHAHNAILVAAFRERPNTSSVDTIASEKHGGFAITKLMQVLEENVAKNRDVLLSAELLPAFKLNELEALYSLLTKYTQEIIAVGYIRSPKAYIESAFQEALKAGKVTSFDIEKAFFQEELTAEKTTAFNFLDMRFFHYQTFFEKFDLVFGKENVHFWKFDPATFPNRCVVTDFCERLQINIDPESIIRVNDGLSLEGASLRYVYSKYREELKFESVSDIKLRFSLKIPNQNKARKLHFSSAIIAPILEKNRGQIEWMETRMGASLAEDISKDDENAIQSEEQLMTFAPETIKWLAEQLGDDYVTQWHPQMSAQEVAQWVHLLRLKIANRNQSSKNRAEKQTKKVLDKQDSKRTNIKQLMQAAKKTAPHLKDLPDAKAILLVREIFKQIANDIEGTDEGTLKVAGLGRFTINSIQPNQEEISERIIFEIAKDKNLTHKSKL